MLKKTILLVVGTFFLWGTISCGTLIYPERRGQRGGRIDPAVAILDGVALLVFIVPGLIAYAIDFSTGAIYLPGTRESGIEAGVKVVQIRNDKWSAIAAAIEQHTGDRPNLNEPGLRIYLAAREAFDSGRELASIATGQPVADTWTTCSISPTGVLSTAEGRLVTVLRQE